MKKKNPNDPGIPSFGNANKATQDTIREGPKKGEENISPKICTESKELKCRVAKVLLRIPLAETDLECKHISVVLNSNDRHIRRILGRLFMGLKFDPKRKDNYALKKGKFVATQIDAIRWLLEQVESVLEKY